MSSPFLHLGSRNIDTVSLAATAHGEVDIKGRKALAQVTLGDHVERSRVVKDVVVESEVTATEDTCVNRTVIFKFARVWTYLGIRLTPRSLRLVQLAFLTSAAALVSSSAESLPAQ